MDRFRGGHRFLLYFRIYYKAWILPEQEKAAKTRTQRPRGPDQATVEQRMLIGERPGCDKYSDRFPDKSEWDQTDHLACLLTILRDVNLKSNQGLFYGKGLTDADVNLML